MVLNGVMNKKNTFLVSQSSNNDYIEPFQKESKKMRQLRFRHNRLQHGKNTQFFDTLLKDTDKYKLSYRAHKNISQEEKVNDHYYSSLFVFDDLFMQLISRKTFLAHMTSVCQHGIQDVMLTQNFSGKDIFST